MIHQTFQIKWEHGQIIYDPLAGLLKDTATGKTVTIRRNNHHDCFLGSAYTPPGLAKSFTPFCLTIYMNHQCNLACRYCYVQGKNKISQITIDLSAVTAAAEFVARNCVERHKPFVLGFHGGNEPLLNPDLICQCLEICHTITQKYDVKLLSFCTTNGVVPEETARWAASTFYGIRLSWDGPPEIHDSFRLTADGAPTSENVIRSARIFLEKSSGLEQFIIRTTVTGQSISNLCDIVEYFYEQGVRWVEVYPIFQNAEKSLDQNIIPIADDFVHHFLLASELAKQKRLKLLFAGSRFNDFHDKHCMVFQNNLTLTPDSHLTACFLATHNQCHKYDACIYGHYDRQADRLMIDWDKLATIFNRISKPYDQCIECFNYFHCSKGCPMVCPLQENSDNPRPFDCTIEKRIGIANILSSAGYRVPNEDNCFFENIHIERIETNNEF